MERAVILYEADNVATTIDEDNLQAGETIEVTVGQLRYQIRLLDSVQYGHKFALKDIPKGSHLIKYDEVMGVATSDILTGQHVHVHNVISPRAKLSAQEGEA